MATQRKRRSSPRRRTTRGVLSGTTSRRRSAPRRMLGAIDFHLIISLAAMKMMINLVQRNNWKIPAPELLIPLAGMFMGDKIKFLPRLREAGTFLMSNWLLNKFDLTRPLAGDTESMSYGQSQLEVDDIVKELENFSGENNRLDTFYSGTMDDMRYSQAKFVV